MLAAPPGLRRGKDIYKYTREATEMCKNEQKTSRNGQKTSNSAKICKNEQKRAKTSKNEQKQAKTSKACFVLGQNCMPGQLTLVDHLPTAYCLPPTTHHPPPTTYQLLTTIQLPTTNYQLPTTNYQLPTTNYQLPTKRMVRSYPPFLKENFFDRGGLPTCVATE
jgi:hypothetical protein